jgi:hypothetical protein
MADIEITVGGKCEIWQGAKDKDGYGLVKIRGKQMKAHRVAKEIEVGRKLKKEECVMHLCDNPSCFRKEHLKVGTVAQNNRMKRDRQETLVDTYLKGWKEIYE